MYISMRQVAKQASELSLPLDTRLIQLTAHGLAHLLGYDHHTQREAEQMLAVEKQWVAALNETTKGMDLAFNPDEEGQA